MTVLEVMERIGVRDTARTIAYIKDALLNIKSNTQEEIVSEKQNIISGVRDYRLPADKIAIVGISVLDTDDDKYKQIRELKGDIVLTEDTSP